MGHFILFKTQNGALRARLPPVAASLFSFILLMCSSSLGKAPGEKNCFPLASNSGSLRHWAIGNIFHEAGNGGKIAIGEQIRQTNKRVRHTRMTEPPMP
jgi:hypothetical protein